MPNKLEQLDREWDLAVMRNVRIQTALVCLINQNVELLQRHSNKKLEEVN